MIAPSTLSLKGYLHLKMTWPNCTRPAEPEIDPNSHCTYENMSVGYMMQDNSTFTYVPVGRYTVHMFTETRKRTQSIIIFMVIK